MKAAETATRIIGGCSNTSDLSAGVQRAENLTVVLKMKSAAEGMAQMNSATRQEGRNKKKQDSLESSSKQLEQLDVAQLGISAPGQTDQVNAGSSGTWFETAVTRIPGDPSIVFSVLSGGGCRSSAKRPYAVALSLTG